MHPSSVNSQLQVPQPAEQGASHTCPVMIFDEITRGEAMLYVRQCTAVGAHALLLVCTHLRIAPEEEPRSSTGEPAGLRTHATARPAAALLKLRPCYNGKNVVHACTCS